MRIAPLLFYAVLLTGLVSVREADAADAAFQMWLQSLWPGAQQLGVSRATF
jgi:membrane-bound lytic murein transglycosylase B